MSDGIDRIWEYENYKYHVVPELEAKLAAETKAEEEAQLEIVRLIGMLKDANRARHEAKVELARAKKLHQVMCRTRDYLMELYEVTKKARLEAECIAKHQEELAQDAYSETLAMDRRRQEAELSAALLRAQAAKALAGIEALRKENEKIRSVLCCKCGPIFQAAPSNETCACGARPDSLDTHPHVTGCAKAPGEAGK